MGGFLQKKPLINSAIQTRFREPLSGAVAKNVGLKSAHVHRTLPSPTSITKTSATESAVIVVEEGAGYLNAPSISTITAPAATTNPFSRDWKCPAPQGASIRCRCPFRFPRASSPCPAAAGADIAVRQKGEPQRMVVVHAFPKETQMIEFQKALRMVQQDEMLKRTTRICLGRSGSTSFALSSAGRQVKSEVLSASS